MVVEPVDDKRVEDNNKLIRNNKVQHNNEAVVAQAKKEERKKPAPSLANIAHNSYFERLETTLIKPDQVKTDFVPARLSLIDPNSEIEFFGEVLSRSELENLFPQLLESFEREISTGNNSEALVNLKKFPPQLQQRILEQLIVRLDDQEDGPLAYLQGLMDDARVLEFVRLALTDNTLLGNLSKEDRLQLEAKLNESSFSSFAQFGIDSLNAVTDISKIIYGTISEKLQVLFDDTQELAALADKLSQQQKISSADLGEIEEKAEKARLTIQHARLAVGQLKALGENEQAAELENKIIVMEQAVRELTKTVESFLSNCTEEQRTAVQNIVTKVNKLFQQRVVEIADYIRDQAAHGVRIALSQDVLAIVNPILSAAGKTPLDRALFAKGDGTGKNNIAEVLLGNYDLSYQDNNLANLQISIGFIYDTVISVFSTDREERQRLREQKLADAREVEKFLEQYIERVKETQKRLDKIAFQKALSDYSNTIKMYLNVVQEIINNYGKNESKLGWYKALLETETQKQVARTIYEINKSV